jgi:ABC-type Na+ transport system ATPase subunit NatA
VLIATRHNLHAEIICEALEAGKTVFFSSHILSDVEALCDRVIMLDKRVKTTVAIGKPGELRDRSDNPYAGVIHALLLLLRDPGSQV